MILRDGSRAFFTLLSISSLSAAAVWEFVHGDVMTGWRNVGLLLIAMELARRPQTNARRR